MPTSTLARPPGAAPPAAVPAFEAASPELPARLALYLSRLWQASVEVSAWERFPGGMSWVTFGFHAAWGGREQDLILRVGDPGGLFGSYRTEPEFLALTALADVPGLPIPRMVLRCEDLAVLGAPFLISHRVGGDAPTPWDRAAFRDEAQRQSLAAEFSVALGALHGFDWTGTPLQAWADGLSGREPALREIRRWAAECGYPAIALPPAMHYAMRWLEANAPETGRVVVVHGDYRVGNFLRQGPRISAILDWELVHLGDPHEDLAWAGLRAFGPGSSRVGGLVDRDEFHRRYNERSGIAVDAARLRYFSVLMQFKSAAMLLGATRRVEAGSGRDVRMASMGFQVAPTVMELLRLMEDVA